MVWTSLSVAVKAAAVNPTVSATATRRLALSSSQTRPLVPRFQGIFFRSVSSRAMSIEQRWEKFKRGKEINDSIPPKANTGQEYFRLEQRLGRTEGAKQWKKLTPNMKQAYEDLARNSGAKRQEAIRKLPEEAEADMKYFFTVDNATAADLQWKALSKGLPKYRGRSYNMFFAENIQEGKSPVEAAEIWRGSSDSFKAEYVEKAERSKEVFTKGIEKWYKALTEDEQKLVQSREFRKAMPTFARIQFEERFVPKKKASIYATFVKQKFKEVFDAQDGNKTEKMGKTGKALSVIWKSLSAAEKESYRT